MSVRPPDVTESLLERASEQDELLALIDRVRAGSGGVLVVEGPAGIGKTLLLDVLRDAARDNGFSVGRARAGSLELDLAFGVVRQMLEPLVTAAGGDALFAGAAAAAAPVLGRSAQSIDPDDIGPGTVVHGLYWLVVALVERLGPLALICDDAHWADAPSVRFLSYLGNRVEDHQIAVVIGTRPPDPGVAGEILDRLLGNQVVRRLRPGPLTRDAVHQLVRRSFGDAQPAFCDAVADASGGNPFFVSELVRAARDAGTTAGLLDPSRLSSLSVSDTVMSRIGALPGSALDVAKAVAVLGSDAHLRHVASLAGLDVDAAGAVSDQLIRSDVLRPGRPLGFVHPLVEAALYGRMLPGERSTMHRDAVRLLSAEAAPAERVAPHVMASEPAGDESMVEVLTTSAAHGMEQGATELAIRQLRRALAEPAPPDARFGILLPLAIGEWLVNDPAAIDHFGEAIGYLPHPNMQLQLVTAQAAMLSMSGRTAAGVATLRDFVTSSDVPDAMSTHVLAAINVAASVGPIDAPLLKQCIADFKTALDPTANDLTRVPAGVLAIRGFVGAISGESAPVVSRLLDRALAVVDERDPMFPLWGPYIVTALLMIGRDAMADAALNRWLTPARRSGAPAQVSIMLCQRGLIAYRAGDLEDAWSDASASLDVCSEHQLRYVLPAAMSVIIDLMRERGELLEAADVLRRHGADRRRAECLFDHMLVLARGRLRGAQGQWDLAVDDFRRGWVDATESGSGSTGLAAWQAYLSEALVMVGRPGEAAEVARAAIGEADAVGLLRPRAEALRALALSEPANAGDLLAEASRIFGELGARLEVARTAAAAMFVHRLGGPRPELDSLTQALWLAERCSANALRDHLRVEMRTLGVRAKVRPVTGVGSLTASERRVAALAAAGRSNKEIAQELFVTVKTVETHMAKSFQKLGISSRSDIRRVLSDPA